MIYGQPVTFGGAPALQEKTVSPSTSKQTVTPDADYDGLAKVTVNAMPTAEQTTPSISVDADGLITAKATQTAGYVSAGTKSATKQLTVQAAKTVTPSTSEQTAVASGRYTTGAVKVAAIPSDYVKPTETKEAATYTPKTTSQTIAAGTYCSGAQTIKGDTNLKAANIAKDVSIFGVTGTYTGAPVLLWENASPSSVFGEQTVNISGSGYSSYLVEVQNKAEVDAKSIDWVNKTTARQALAAVDPVGVAGSVTHRFVSSATANSITFSDGYSGSHSSHNLSCIPTRIWGVKWTIS